MEAKNRIVKTTEENCHNTLEERLAEQDKISFKAGMEEEASGGHNSISFLEGYQDGEKLAKEVVEAIKVYDKNYAQNDWGNSKFRESLLWWLNTNLKSWGIKED